MDLLKEHQDLLREWELTYKRKINRLLEEKTVRLMDIQRQFFEKLNEMNDSSTPKSTNSTIATIPSLQLPSLQNGQPSISDIKYDSIQIPSLPDLPPIAYVLQEAINSLNQQNSNNSVIKPEMRLDLNELFGLNAPTNPSTIQQQQQDHKSFVIPPIKANNNNQIKWPCTHCSAQFASSQQLVKHLAVHTLGINNKNKQQSDIGHAWYLFYFWH